MSASMGSRSANMRSGGQQHDRPPRRPRRRLIAEESRQRVVRACTNCRRLKEKCNGQQPCQRCSRSGRACEFEAAQTSKGSGPHHGVREPSHGHQQGVSQPADERVKCLETLVSRLIGEVPKDLDQLQRISDSLINPGQFPGAPQQNPGDLEGLALEEENFTVKTLSQGTAHYSGEFSHWNFSQKLRQRLAKHLGPGATHISTERPVSGTVGNSSRLPGAVRPENRSKGTILEYWRATHLQSPRSLVMSVLDSLPPRYVADYLTQTYFQFAQTNCFYVEETWLRSKLALLYDVPGEVTSSDAAWVCVLLMVLAIGTQFAHMSASSEGVQTISQNMTNDPEQEEDVGLAFYQAGTKLIPDIITAASLESVQACLLLAHYTMPLDTHGLSYTYLGLGIKIAIQNGMHRKYSGNDIDSWTVEMRNRLWWTAYTVERRIGVLHGRPAAIATSEMDAILPKDMPEFRMQRDVLGHQFGNMAALIDLTLRLSSASDLIALLRRSPKALQLAHFDALVELTNGLQAWWSSQREDVRTPTNNSPIFRSNAHLKLSFCMVQIFIGRPFTFADRSGASLASTPQSQQPHADHPSRRAVLVNSAINAAFEAIELCKLLNETVGLARASYTEFGSCRAALLLLLAQSIESHNDQMSEAISLGVQFLRTMAARNVSMQSETSVIEAIDIAVQRLRPSRQEQNVGQDVDAAGNTNNASKSGYERFKEWTSNRRSSRLPDQIPVAAQLAEESTLSPYPLISDLDMDMSSLNDFGLLDIFNSFPQGVVDGALQEWSGME